jgi:hypothetical protein
MPVEEEEVHRIFVALALLSIGVAPSRPALLIAQASTSASVVLSWSANPAGDEVQGYRVEVLEAGASAAQLLDAGNVVQFKVAGLKPSVSYRFRVMAYSILGESDFSAPVSSTPNPPFGADGVCAPVAGSAPEVSVIVQSYDLQAQRSNPRGMHVAFDAGSSEPIVRIELDMEGDGEPAIPITFPVGLGFDGRYVRGLDFKPTVNGTWPLLVSATDAVGRKSTTRCTPGVTVGF